MDELELQAIRNLGGFRATEKQADGTTREIPAIAELDNDMLLLRLGDRYYAFAWDDLKHSIEQQ